MALARQSDFNWAVYLAGWLVIMLVSMSVHYANEYADYETDTLTSRTSFSGGSGALPELNLPRATAWWAMWAVAAFALILMVVFYLAGLQNLVGLGLLGFILFFGWMYSLPPLALAWRGWGELDNAMLGGVALPIYGYAVFTGTIDMFVFTASLPFGMLVFINLLATTWADRKADELVGKYTLATLWPIRRLRGLFGLVAGAVLLAIFFVAPFPPLVLQTSLVIVPVMGWGLATYTRWNNPFPTVLAMLVMLFAQLLSWFVVVYGLQIKL